MTCNSLQGHGVTAEYVVGAPGPPRHMELQAASCYFDEENEDDMFCGGVSEPDDLGDLMKEIRDGGWGEGLAMDCELPLGSECGPEPPPPAAAVPGQHQPPQGGTSAEMVLRYMQAQQAQQAAMLGMAADQPPPPPSVAALLMHPGACCVSVGGGGVAAACNSALPSAGSGHMIPVAGCQQGATGVGCSLALSLQPASSTAGLGHVLPQGVPASWPQAQTTYYAPPHTAAMAVGQQGQQAPPPFYCYSVPVEAPNGLAGMGPSALPFYQTSPASFGTLQPQMAPPQAAAQAHMQQKAAQQLASGAFDPALLACLPQGSTGPLTTYQAPQPPAPEPNSSGSGNASDGTTLRLRNSFEGDSGSGPMLSASQRPSHHPAQHHTRRHTQRSNSPRQHTTQPAHVSAFGMAAAPSRPQLCSGFALAAFDQAAFDQAVLDQVAFGQATAGGPYCSGSSTASVAATATAGGAAAVNVGAGVFGGADGRAAMLFKCEAPSDSSDVEDNMHSLNRQCSLADQCAQVVPDALQYSNHHTLGVRPGCALAPAEPSAALAAAVVAAAAASPAGMQHPAAVPAPPPPPIPAPYLYYDSPAAQTARMARQASLERYRLKKARRGFGKKIRYQARKDNADKRPRVKGRFVKAGEAADMIAAAAAAAAASAAVAAASTAASVAAVAPGSSGNCA